MIAIPGLSVSRPTITTAPCPARPGRGGGYVPPNGWCRHDDTDREEATTADDPERALCTQDINCAVLKAAALKDGLVETDCANTCAAGTNKKALAIDPLTAAERADAKLDAEQIDYHGLRQDKDGSWSSKPGADNPENQAPDDSSGAGKGGPIKDPTMPASWGSCTEFCGCFCCGPAVRKAEATPQLASAGAGPSGGLLAQEPPRPLPPPGGVVISALIFSGRPNPRWQITEAPTLDTLAGLLDIAALRPAAILDWPSLGPRGFLVTTEDPASLRVGTLPSIVRVHRGVIVLGERYYLDDRALEAWIAANWTGGSPGAR